MTKIAYDFQVFSWQKTGGISKYFFELMSRLNESIDCRVDLGLWYSENPYISNCQFSRHRRLQLPDFKGKRQILEWLNERRMAKFLTKAPFDIFHPTFYNPYFLNQIGLRPYVVTVFDMIHELFPEMVNNKVGKVSEWKKELVRRADGIIAISESTKNDLVNILKIDEKKIKVIYLASSIMEIAKCSVDSQLLLPDKYLLYVGDRDGYKNFQFLASALRPILKKYENLKVLCIGGRSFSKGECEMFSSFGLNSQFIQQYATEEQLPEIYRKAELFVLPALYEGFGIPLLEAFGSGCPVVSSCKGSLKEVGEGAPMYFDPQSESSLQSALEHVIDNDETKKEMRARGCERMKSFSWELTAQQTLDYYRTILG